MRPISKGDFAKERKVSAGRVSQWLADGRIVETEDGKIDADAAHASLDAALDRAKGMRRTGNVTSVNDAGAGAQDSAASGSAATLPTKTEAATPAHRDAVELRPDVLELRAEAGAAGEQPTVGGGEPGGQNGKEGTRDNSGYWEHKAKREKYESQLAEIKYLQAAGGLVHAAGVRREAMEAARSVRNAMLSIPDNISAVLDPANPARAHKLLTGEIQKVLRELCLGLEQRAAAAPAGAAEPEGALL